MVDSYIEQQVKYLELENYAFNSIVLWLHPIMKPTDVQSYKDLIDLAELLWDRVGRGTTLLTEIPIENWLRITK